MKISIERVIPNRFNPNSLSQDQYELLRRDVAEHDLEYPIEVRPLENGLYEIVDGEHRWKVCKELGFKEIECEVKDIGEAEAKQRNYRLNSARGTIDPLKEALLFQSEIESGMTQQQVADKYGRSQQFISSRLVLLRLPERVKRKITTRVVTPSHGELLARLPDEEAVENLTQRVVKKRLSVPETEKWVEWYAKLKELEEKHSYKKDAVTAHRTVIEAKDSEFPSFGSLESLEWRLNQPTIQVKEQEEWPKQRLLDFLGNRLYNNVTCRTEPPEELINSPQIKEECEFYLARLRIVKVSHEEILSFLRQCRQKQIRWIEDYQKKKAREKTFKDKVDELYAKFKQLTVEFTDGTKIPLNIQSLPTPYIFYDGNNEVRPNHEKYPEFYLKRVILPPLVKASLGFNEYGEFIEQEVERHG